MNDATFCHPDKRLSYYYRDITKYFVQLILYFGQLTLQRGVTGTARMLHALTHSSISRQVREQM